MRSAIISVILLIAAALPSARADDACTDFKWDVAKERALFAAAPTPIKAGRDAKAAPSLVPGKLYQIQLLAQASVNFVLEPGRKSRADSDHAGLAILKMPASGAYRVAMDMPLWVDVVANATLLPATDFQGQHDCNAPHKIVVFDLAIDQALTLQLSSSAADSVRLTITPAPARKF
jgi:hypothetical protein